jgi:hypothetical protein
VRLITRTALVIASAALPTALLAQGLTIKSVTDTRFYGGLGTVMNLASKFGGTNLHDLPTTTYLSGHKLRIEGGDMVTIIDADAGRLISIDNKAKTYSSVTFDEMAEAMRRAQESAKQNEAKQNEAKQSGNSKSNAKDPKGDVNMKYKVQADRPGQRERIAGYDAERVFLTITMEAEATPEGGQTEQVGSIVLLLDQWISKDAPQSAAMAEFQRAYAQKAGQAFKAQTQALQTAFSTADPRLKGGMDAAATEMAKIQGTPLRSMMYFTLVPPNLQFDRNLALNDVSGAPKDDKAKSEDKPKSGGFGGFIGKVKAAAEEANKNSDNKKSSEPPKQTTLATSKDEVISIAAGPVSADLFAPPAGYREVKR